jgi:hypothetical protein
MNKPARGQGRRNKSRGRGRSRQSWEKVDDIGLLPVQSVNRQQGTRWQQNPSPVRRENDRRLTYNQERLRDRNFQ